MIVVRGEDEEGTGGRASYGIIIVFVPYSYCIPVGRGGEDGIMNSYRMTIVIEFGFKCTRIGKGKRGTATLSHSYCIRAVILSYSEKRRMRRKGGENELLQYSACDPTVVRLRCVIIR